MRQWPTGLPRVGLHFIPPGEPWRNGYVESFNSRIRDECLNINSFWSLAQARVVISDWKHQYHQHRRHSALGCRTPAEYAAACRPHPGACIINGTAIDFCGSVRVHENYWTILDSTLITRAWRARELLAAEYDRAGCHMLANEVRAGDTGFGVSRACSLRAIVAALEPLADPGRAFQLGDRVEKITALPVEVSAILGCPLTQLRVVP